MFWQVRYRYDNRNQKVQMIARSYAKRRQWKGLRKMPNGRFTSTKIETRLPIVSERSEGSWRRKMDYLQNLHCFYVNRLYHCAGSIRRPPFCKPSRRNPCDCSPAHAVFCYSKHSVLNLRCWLRSIRLGVKSIPHPGGPGIFGNFVPLNHKLNYPSNLI